MVNRLVQMAGFKTTVLDNDLATIQLMRRFGFKGFFGDPTRPELLHAAGLDTARVLVVAVDDRAAAVRLVAYARRERPDLHIVARAHDRVHVYELYHAGANDIVREMFDSSLRAGRYVLENMGLTEFEADEMERIFYQQGPRSRARTGRPVETRRAGGRERRLHRPRAGAEQRPGNRPAERRWTWTPTRTSAAISKTLSASLTPASAKVAMPE